MAATLRTDCLCRRPDGRGRPASDRCGRSIHACGSLTDLVIERAVAGRARFAVLPCCHDLAACDPGDLSGWVSGPIAIDIRRAVRLEKQGYRVWTQTIPAEITPQNRLLLGAPSDSLSLNRSPSPASGIG